MLGDFITRSLVMLLGYAYPAFECYKTVEKNKGEIEELRFWCQYWIIVALLTVFERVGDIFISWLPMYGELKLALFIYLWHPKTKGTSYVYETFFRPYIAKHETNIDRKLIESRERALDLAILYWKYCSDYGQSTFFKILEHLAAHASRAKDSTSQKANSQYYMATPPSSTASLHRQPDRQTTQTSKKEPSRPPSPQTTLNRMVSPPPKTDLIQDHLPYETHSQPIVGHATIAEPDPTNVQETDMTETLRSARIRLRRSRLQQ